MSALPAMLLGLLILALIGDGGFRILRRLRVVEARSPEEWLGLRVLVALALVPAIFVTFDLTGVPIGRVSVGLFAALLFGGALAWDRIRPGNALGYGRDAIRQRWAELRGAPVAIALILATATYSIGSFAYVLSRPPWVYDGLVGWDLVAKVLSYEGKVRSSVFTEIQFNAQCVYAPFTSLNQGFWYLFTPDTPRLWVALLVTGFSLVVWSRFRNYTGSPTAAGLITFLLFTPPNLTFHLTVAQTDMPTMVYTTLAFLAAAEFARGERGILPVVFFSLVATASRTEGVLFAAAITGILLLFRKRAGIVSFWVGGAAALLFAFWNLFFIKHLIGYDPGTYFRDSVEIDFGRISEVLTRAAQIVANRGFYGELIWIIVTLPLVWAIGRWGSRRRWWTDSPARPYLAPLGLLLFLSFLFYMPFFYMWNDQLNPLWTMEHTFKRGFFRFVPVLLFLWVSSPPVLGLLRKTERSSSRTS
ncbi:MAG: hypothetical protein R3E97_11145 [Candidatus Eisenbacteria bacterium]